MLCWRGKAYFFCPQPDCPVVYYSDGAGQGVRVKVCPRNRDPHFPVCYCFGLTREKPATMADAVDYISGRIRAGRRLLPRQGPGFPQ